MNKQTGVRGAVPTRYLNRFFPPFVLNGTLGLGYTCQLPGTQGRTGWGIGSTPLLPPFGCPSDSSTTTACNCYNNSLPFLTRHLDPLTYEPTPSWFYPARPAQFNHCIVTPVWDFPPWVGWTGSQPPDSKLEQTTTGWCVLPYPTPHAT